MRKVLFHLNCFEQGGAERVVSNLVNQLVQEDYEVIAATQWQGEAEFALDERVNRIHVGLRDEDESKNRLVKIILRFKYLRDLIKKEKPDVVISFTRRPNYRALISAWGLKVPVIPAVRQDPKSYYNSFADKLLIPLLYPMAAGCVFQTTEQMESFPKSLRKRSAVILNPVNAKYVNVPKPEHREKTVVQSGRIVDFKNQAMLLRAFVKVHEKHPDYDLKLYGGDSFDGTWEQLEEIIRKNHAEDYIRLMGGSDSLEKELEALALENRLMIENKDISLVAFYQDGDRYILRLLNNQQKQAAAQVSLCGVNATVTFGKYQVKTLCYADGVLKEQEYIC